MPILQHGHPFCPRMYMYNNYRKTLQFCQYFQPAGEISEAMRLRNLVVLAILLRGDSTISQKLSHLFKKLYRM